MAKLHTLTTEQQALLATHRANWFTIATSTQPADRHVAEKTARELAGIAGIKIQRVVWVATPEAGAAAYRDSFSGSFSDSLELAQGSRLAIKCDFRAQCLAQGLALGLALGLVVGSVVSIRYCARCRIRRRSAAQVVTYRYAATLVLRMLGRARDSRAL